MSDMLLKLAYMRVMNEARVVGIPDRDIAEVVVALRPDRPTPDELHDALLQYAPGAAA